MGQARACFTSSRGGDPTSSPPHPGFPLCARPLCPGSCGGLSVLTSRPAGPLPHCASHSSSRRRSTVLFSSPHLFRHVACLNHEVLHSPPLSDRRVSGIWDSSFPVSVRVTFSLFLPLLTRFKVSLAVVVDAYSTHPPFSSHATGSGICPPFP